MDLSLRAASARSPHAVVRRREIPGEQEAAGAGPGALPDRPQGAAAQLPPAVPSLAGCFLSGVFAARVITAHGRQPPPGEGGNDR